jgi:L-asparaginase II
MNEHELRSLVRAAVARHLGTAASPHADDCPNDSASAPFHAVPVSVFSSHSLYAGLVKCDHCGYCKSHGH